MLAGGNGQALYSTKRTHHCECCRASSKMGCPSDWGSPIFGKTESGDQLERLLCLRLSHSNWLCRKLEHCRLLIFNQVSQQHDLTVWKLQRIMMCMRVLLVDLSEDRCRVIDGPRDGPRRVTTHFRCKGEFCSRKHTNCDVAVFGRSKPYGASVKEASCQFVANPGRS